MISLGSNEEQSSELMELIKKFPTSAYVAERLHRVGWGSDYGQSLLNHFREELLQECGKELSEALERFRAFKLDPKFQGTTSDQHSKDRFRSRSRPSSEIGYVASL